MLFIIKNIFLFLFFIISLTKNIFADDFLSLENNFFPEGITAAKNGDLFVGSLKENKIVKFINNNFLISQL